MNIYLAHPGENDGTQLTENGIWQLQSLGRRLATEGLRIVKVYANGHAVSQHSAQILSKYIGAPVVHDERFTEIKKDLIEGKFTSEDTDNLEYIHLFVDEILRKGEDVILTLGDGIHRAVISRLTGMPLISTRHFSLSTASLSIIKYRNFESTGSWRISTVNDVNHLRTP